MFAKRQTIADREDDYRKQKYTHLLISPSRPDVFTEDTDANPFSDAMRSNQFQQEKQNIEHQLKTKTKDSTLKEQPVKKRRRWDQAGDGTVDTPSSQSHLDSSRSKGAESMDGVTPRTRNQWDETPGRPKDPSATPGQISVRQWAETPAHVSDSMTPARDLGATPSVRHNRFDETPHTDRIGNETPGHGAGWSETPRAGRTPGVSVRDDLSTVHDTPGTSKKRSRWDETPLQGAGGTPMTGTPGGFTPSMTPSISFTPGGITPAGDKARLMATPGYVPCTPEQLQAFKWQREIDERNRNFTDIELEELLPTGYRIVAPPPGYAPLRAAGQRLIGTPTPAGTPAGFKMATPDGRGRMGGLNNAMMGDLQPSGDLPLMRPDDIQYFDKLLEDVDEDSLSSAELKEREIMKLLLKIKNGTPPIRKSAMRQITSKVCWFLCVLGDNQLRMGFEGVGVRYLMLGLQLSVSYLDGAYRISDYHTKRRYQTLRTYLLRNNVDNYHESKFDRIFLETIFIGRNVNLK